MPTSLEKLQPSAAARAEILELRARAAKLESELRIEGVPDAHATPAAVQQVVAEQWKNSVTEPAIAPEHLGAVTLELTPEEHDSRMADLLGVLQEKGVAHAIAAAEATNNAHIIDDFHRVLVEYVREGFVAKGVEDKEYKKALTLTLFEVVLPSQGSEEQAPNDPTKTIHDTIALMEQFYRGMLQMNADAGEYFSFEIANPAGALHTSVYVAVPTARKELFEKQLLSLYPTARLLVRHDDYNAFADSSEVAAATASLAERPIYSLRTFEAIPSDPLDVLLNSFSKLDKTGEGAALQLIISPQDLELNIRYKEALAAIRTGTPIKDATNIKTGTGRLVQEVQSFFAPTEKLKVEDRPSADDPRVKNIEHKIASPILHVNIRLVSSASTKERAAEILEGLEAPFQQFADTAGNSLVFKPISTGNTKKFVHSFSYRLLDEPMALPLSATELATLAHLPRPGSNAAAPDLRQAKSATAPHQMTYLNEECYSV